MATYAHELIAQPRHPGQLQQPVHGTASSATATGMWDMMSRGSFNGPGGQHTRFLIPPTQGSALGSQHNMRNKRFLNFLTDGDLLRLNRDGLAQSGMAVADVTAREVAPDGGEIAGVQHRARRRRRQGRAVRLPRPTRPATACARSGTGAITGKYNDYTMEVVQQIGSDSFDPGHGVLISKTKNSSSSCGSFSCFVWVIDSHPEDINQVDFVAPGRHAEAWRRSATSASSTTASFNAGLDSGSLVRVRGHRRTACTSTSSTSAPTRRASCTTRSASSRSTAPARRRAASRSAAPQLRHRRGLATCTFTLKNTGAAAATDPACTRRTPSAFLDSDVYRLSATATGTGWSGAPQERARRPPSSARRSRSRSTSTKAHAAPRHGHAQRATSESDPSKTATAVCTLGRRRRRRLRAGDAGADDGHAGLVRRVHAGPRQGLLRPDHGERRSPPPVTRP